MEVEITKKQAWGMLFWIWTIILFSRIPRLLPAKRLERFDSNWERVTALSFRLFTQNLSHNGHGMEVGSVPLGILRRFIGGNKSLRSPNCPRKTIQRHRHRNP